MPVLLYTAVAKLLTDVNVFRSLWFILIKGQVVLAPSPLLRPQLCLYEESAPITKYLHKCKSYVVQSLQSRQVLKGIVLLFVIFL